MTQSPDSTESVDTLAELDGEDIACLGMRRADSSLVEIPTDLRAVFSGAVRRAPRTRKPTLDSVKKQASKAGLEVGAYKVAPDGTITAVIGKSEASEPNPWLEEAAKQ
jgi:hypothetical protein